MRTQRDLEVRPVRGGRESVWGVTAPDHACLGLTDVDRCLPRLLILASGFMKFSPVGASFPVLPKFSRRPTSVFPSAVVQILTRTSVSPDLPGITGACSHCSSVSSATSRSGVWGLFWAVFAFIVSLSFLRQWLSILAVHSNHFVNLEWTFHQWKAIK